MSGYVYRCFDDHGRLLYIGSCSHLAQRMINHRAASPWYGRVATTQTAEFPTFNKAHEAERHAIAAERPLFNIRHNPLYRQPRGGESARQDPRAFWLGDERQLVLISEAVA